MKDNYVYLGFVLDRSGSMSSDNKIDEARNGFNNIIQEKKDNKEFIYDVFLTIFDDHIDHLYEGHINGAPNLNNENFYPRGMTSLYDALGETIDSIGGILKNKPENSRPSKVLITVITDGIENNSHNYDADSIKELINRQKTKYNWEFVFMGTTEEAATSAINMGFDKNRTITYANSIIGTATAYNLMSKTIDTVSDGDFSGYGSADAETALKQENKKNKKKENSK